MVLTHDQDANLVHSQPAVLFTIRPWLLTHIFQVKIIFSFLHFFFLNNFLSDVSWTWYIIYICIYTPFIYIWNYKIIWRQRDSKSYLLKDWTQRPEILAYLRFLPSLYWYSIYKTIQENNANATIALIWHQFSPTDDTFKRAIAIKAKLHIYIRKIFLNFCWTNHI